MKKKKLNYLIVIGVIVSLIVIFGVLQTVVPSYEIIQLDYSGQTKLSGVEDPSGFVVTGVDNCGGRANKLGYIQYHTCEIDLGSISFTSYEICAEERIDTINSAYIKFSGDAQCLDMKGSTSSCIGNLNIFNENKNNIGNFEQSLRYYSDGLRDTDKINAKVNINMDEYNLFGERCFKILIPNPSKHRAKWDLNANYNIVEAGIDYNPVECEIDSDCELYEQCVNYDCQLKPEEDIIVWRFDNNACKEIEIGSFSVTENDYKNENECTNKIIESEEKTPETIELNTNKGKIIGYSGLGVITFLIILIFIRMRKK